MLNKFIACLLFALLLTMLSNRFDNVVILKYFVYGVLVLFSGWIFLTARKYHSNFFYKKSVFFLLLFLVVSTLFSPWTPLYVRLLKYVAYLSCYIIGFSWKESGRTLRLNNGLFALFCLIPVVLVGIFDPTPHKTLFFQMSNVYTYLGLSCAMLYYTVYPYNKSFFVSWGIIALYIASCSSLGLAIALALSVVIINRKNIRLIIIGSLFVFLLVLLIMFSNLPVFTRLRDIFILSSSLSMQEWLHLDELNFYQLEQKFVGSSGRTDNASFLWRIAHWMKIVKGYAEFWYVSIPFGMGDCFAYKVAGNYPHNEYLKFMTENGIVVLGILLVWVRKLVIRVNGTKVSYFIFAMLIFHITENLIDFFIANVILYFCLGFHYARYKE